MVSFQRLALYGSCMAATFVLGCAAPYPYQPYPYQPYPGGMYGQPQPGYVAPGSTIPPNGGVQLNAPTPINPGTSGGGGGSGSGSGGDAPMWNPDDSGGSSGNGGGNNNVPFYDDPASSSDPTNSGDLAAPPTSNKPNTFNEGQNTYGTDLNPFGSSQTTDSGESENIAFEEDPSPSSVTQPPILQLGAEGSTAVARTEPADSFSEAPRPISLTTAEFEVPVVRAEESTDLELPYNPEAMPNPFGHDAEAYRYLRGLVTYDDRSRSWSIIYNDKPSRDDEYGGVFTLADHSGLSVLNDNDVVYVEGHVSETLTDPYGKPQYIVEHLNKLKPRSAQ